MKKYLIFLLVAALPFLLYGATKITNTQVDKSSVTNSTIDSTQIGNTSPSTARFRWHVANSHDTLPMDGAHQGAYTMWNLSNGVGETNYINEVPANNSGGFQWYNFTPSNFSLLMSLSPGGVLSVPGGITASLNGNAATASAFNHTPIPCSAGFAQTGSQPNGDAICTHFPDAFSSILAANVAAPIDRGPGAYIGWNGLNGGTGETDFVNARGTGIGGFRWYNTDGTSFPIIMSLSNLGDLSVPGQISGASASVTGNIAAVGTVSGGQGNFTAANLGNATVSGNTSTNSLNASSATVSGSASVGTLTAGNFQHGRSGGCIAGSSSYSTCTVTVGFIPGFADNGYDAVCTGVGATNPRAYIGGITKFGGGGGSYVNVTIVNGGSDSGVGFNEVNCMAFR